MAGRGRGRGRGGKGRGRGRATSQPSIEPIATPLPIPSLLPQSSHSQIESRPLPPPRSQIVLTPTPSSHSQTDPTHIPSPNSQTGASANILGDPFPSLSTNPQPQTEDITWGEKDVDGRVWIKSAPGNNFYPEHKTRGVITRIFKKRFEGAWSSWRNVDEDTIDMWFGEFKTFFKWLEKDEDNIKKCFHKKGSESLSNAMFKVRSGEDKGNWINPDILKQLRVEWETEDWQEKSRKAKQNRQSKEEHNVHGGGSRSAREHAKRMKMEKNKEPTCSELSERLHRPNGSPNELCNDKERKISMAGRGRGRGGKGRGRGRATSQPSIQPITTPLPIPSLRPRSSNSQIESRPLLPTHSQILTPNPSSHSQTDPTNIPSPHSQTGAPANILGDPFPSLSTNPQIEGIAWGEEDVDGRVWIKSAPGNNFYPDHKTRGVITRIFKKRFEGAWSCWGNVDEDTIDMWFGEFKRIFKWLEKDEDNIKKCFHSKGSESLSNAMFKVRNGEDKGYWINPDILKQLRVEWETEDWQEKSRKNKQNRQSKEEHNVHGGGSISAKEHAKRMKMENNKEPTCFELYERLHRPKGSPNEWFNDKQRNIAEMYQMRMAERQSRSGEGTSQQSDNDIFLDVVGGISKKGRIYGLGSVAANVKASSALSSMGVVGASSEEVVAMKATIDALVAEVKQKTLEQQMMKQKMDEWERMFTSLVRDNNLRMSSHASIKKIRMGTNLRISSHASISKNNNDDVESSEDDADN